MKRLTKGVIPFISSIGVIVALTACSVSTPHSPQPVFQNNGDAQYLFELELQAGDTIASLSNEYQAEVIVWEPEDNFAILASTQEADSEFLPQSLGLDKNKNALQIPVSALGSSGWMSGVGGWAAGSGGWATGPGGWAVGSGGWAAGDRGWMVGHNGWGLGVNTAFMGENEDEWNQIGLFSAHKASNNLGYGKTVAVIDTGIDLNHPMLKNSLVSPSLWRDFYDNDYTPQDETGGAGAGHGTAVAGIILQVAPQVKILPIRVLGPNGTGDMDDVILAIRHAVKSGADIINISVGSFDNSRTLKRILKMAKRYNVLIVAAGGNTGQENNVLYPAKFSTDSQLRNTVFSIGSVNANDQISQFSASGNLLFGYAPGERIRTAFPGNRLADVSGTSFAAPIFAGSLALVDEPLHYLYYGTSNLGTKIQSMLEKRRIEHKYDIDSGDTNNWKYAGGIIDSNALLHIQDIDNPSFEQGLTGWSYYGAYATTILNGSIYSADGNYLARIQGGGYISKQLYNLEPDTTYEIHFRATPEQLGQQGSITISNTGFSPITTSFTKNSSGSRSMKHISKTFRTGKYNTSATLRISNPSSNSNLYIDTIKLRIED